jgi:hypothetical protein
MEIGYAILDKKNCTNEKNVCLFYLKVKTRFQFSNNFPELNEFPIFQGNLTMFATTEDGQPFMRPLLLETPVVWSFYFDKVSV